MAICRFTMRALKARSTGTHAGKVVNYLQREGEYAPKDNPEIAYLERTSTETSNRGICVIPRPSTCPPGRRMPKPFLSHRKPMNGSMDDGRRRCN